MCEAGKEQGERKIERERVSQGGGGRRYRGSERRSEIFKRNWSTGKMKTKKDEKRNKL